MKNISASAKSAKLLHPIQHREDELLRRVGVALVTGALTLSLIPSPALAESQSADSSSASTSQQQKDNSSTPPQPPSGSDGQAPSAPPDGAGGGQGQGQPGETPSGTPGGGADTQSFDYSGSYSGVLVADGQETNASDQQYSATESDQNAALVQNGGSLTASKVTLEKSGDDQNGDSCNFYGVNSILLSVGDGSLAKVSDSELKATSAGSNALFATDGGTIYAKGDSISTTADNSRGCDATYGGSIIGDSLTISTQGNHCAALATDRGGGNVSITNSSLSTEGSGSPLIYSTGDIEVSGVTGTATGSQIAGMEGLNTILINDSTLESTNEGTTGSDPVANGVIIYQSTSGDAETTTGDAASFQAVNSTLKSSIDSGAMFYVTNTTANILLKQTTLDFDSDAAKLLQVEGNDSNNWGSAGSNGASVNCTCAGEDLSGDISVDSISSLTLYLTAGTSWQGAAVITSNDQASTTSEAPITVNVDASSSWVVSSDSTITKLNVAQGGKVVDTDGNTVTIKDASGKVLVEGTSSVSVTVTDSYSSEVDDNAVQLASDLIDRSSFDDAMGTSTAFALGDQSTDSSSGSSSQNQAESSQEQTSWWDQIVAFFGRIFSF